MTGGGRKDERNEEGEEEGDSVQVKMPVIL
jgi:hypothetical protein